MGQQSPSSDSQKNNTLSFCKFMGMFLKESINNNCLGESPRQQNELSCVLDDNRSRTPLQSPVRCVTCPGSCVNACHLPLATLLLDTDWG